MGQEMGKGKTVSRSGKSQEGKVRESEIVTLEI